MQLLAATGVDFARRLLLLRLRRVRISSTQCASPQCASRLRSAHLLSAHLLSAHRVRAVRISSRQGSLLVWDTRAVHGSAPIASQARPAPPTLVFTAFRQLVPSQ